MWQLEFKFDSGREYPCLSMIVKGKIEFHTRENILKKNTPASNFTKLFFASKNLKAIQLSISSVYIKYSRHKIIVRFYEKEVFVGK